MSNDPAGDTSSSSPAGPPSASPPSHPPQSGYGYQQPYGYPQPYGAPGYAMPQRQGNGLAVAGMVVGIVGVVLCWAWFLGIILGALGVIFGAVGLQRANRMPGTPGRGMAIAGIVCGAVAIVLDVIFLVIIFAAFSALHCTTVNGITSC